MYINIITRQTASECILADARARSFGLAGAAGEPAPSRWRPPAALLRRPRPRPRPHF